MKVDKDTRKLTANKAHLILLGVGIVALGVSFIGFASDKEHFFHSYLLAYVYWLTIGLGGLFLTMIHHLTHTRWAAVLRRIYESVMMVLPWMLILALPIVFVGMDSLYIWSTPEKVADPQLHHLLEAKEWWLTPGKFQIRIFIYFAIWTALALGLYRTSMRQDSDGHTDKVESRFQALSGLGMPLFVLSLTAFSFDFLMSLDPYWFSTIFGVYIFAGACVGIYAFVTLVATILRSRGALTDEITEEHYHDLGKLSFTFVVFWAYIAFSQYFLIWYANLPEETEWFLTRQSAPWLQVSLLLVVGHFALPFLALLSRIPKRNAKIMTAAAIWLLFIHWVDIYWLVMPSLVAPVPFETGAATGPLPISWMDLTLLVGIGGIFCGLFWRQYQSQPVLPVKDPFLADSLAFQNH